MPAQQLNKELFNHPSGLNGGSKCEWYCTMEFKPVCDSQGNTHGNKCAFEMAACKAKEMNVILTMAKEGSCQGDGSSSS